MEAAIPEPCRAVILEGGCLDRMREMEAESVDAVVTDPPYGLSKEPDIAEVLTHWLAGDDYIHKGGGFMGKPWDSFVPGPAVWREVYRVLKPGGHLLCFSGTRTQDLMGISLRLAGFQVKETIQWIYGSGFPKNHDVSKAIDKLAGAEREVVGKNPNDRSHRDNALSDYGLQGGVGNGNITAPATDEARKREGFGSALKPAHEPILLCRKPLSESSIARNVLKHGTGAINVNASRISHGADVDIDAKQRDFNNMGYQGAKDTTGVSTYKPAGRFPANLILSHSAECRRIGEKRVKGDSPKPRSRQAAKFSGIYNGGKSGVDANNHTAPNGYADPDGKETVEDWECSEKCPVRILGEQSGESEGDDRPRQSGSTFASGANRTDKRKGHDDKGTAARFFMCFEPDTGAGFRYQSKASKRDRSSNGAVENIHPTTKSTSLMAYLVRMVTPPDGTVLDPFAGSGSTLVAAVQEGFDCIGIEAEPEYVEIAQRRIAHCTKQEDSDKLF